MRTLIESWKALLAVDGRVEARLRRDAGAALPEPPPELTARISRALRSAGTAPRAEARLGPRRYAIVGAIAAAAGVIAAGLMFAFGGARSKPAVEHAARMESASIDPARPVPRAEIRLAAVARMATLLRPPGVQLARAVDEPLLVEARLLADDGERIARALVESLPRPLRQSFSGVADPTPLAREESAHN